MALKAAEQQQQDIILQQQQQDVVLQYQHQQQQEGGVQPQQQVKFVHSNKKFSVYAQFLMTKLKSWRKKYNFFKFFFI